MTVIAQDDHLTAGAWAACALAGCHQLYRCTYVLLLQICPLT